MPKLPINDIKGIFTYGDSDDISKDKVKSLVNFRPVNGKLVKTHGAGDTGTFIDLQSIQNDYRVTNVLSFVNSHFSGDHSRTILFGTNIKTNSVEIFFDEAI
jgi:hypothetical protein